MPRHFQAKLDDPRYPCLVTLYIRMRSGALPQVRVVLDPRVDRTDALLDFNHLWLGGNAPLDSIGSVDLPVPLLTRDALVRAAMPRDRPFVREWFVHCASVERLLPLRRAARKSHHELAVMRWAYYEARADTELKKYEIQARVYEAMHEAFPDQWPYGERKTPDYHRLRPYLADLDREISVTETGP